MTDEELQLKLALAMLNAAAVLMAGNPNLTARDSIDLAMETFQLAWTATDKTRPAT